MCRAEPTELEKPTQKKGLDLSSILGTYGQLHLAETQNSFVYNTIVHDNNIIQNNMRFPMDDLEIVMTQTATSRAVAAQALEQHRGDIVDAIMYLVQ